MYIFFGFQQIGAFFSVSEWKIIGHKFSFPHTLNYFFLQFDRIYLFDTLRNLKQLSHLEYNFSCLNIRSSDLYIFHWGRKLSCFVEYFLISSFFPSFCRKIFNFINNLREKLTYLTITHGKYWTKFSVIIQLNRNLLILEMGFAVSF